ncbi:mitochondrial enolase superfamily member 1-like [Bolinopsis microptera]|uniref:mitochondrial enolase superfamily member 1-like n=1 Tax=Bolinopsis microptera TaxID=2820187 RepID=UPI003079F8D1
MFSRDKIVEFEVQDVRYPTSKTLDGSDSVHTDPDYSVAYVTLTTDKGVSGYGITFTLGAGTDVVVKAIELLKRKVLDKSLHDIFTNYRAFYRSLTQDSQMRWLGPEKGIVHLATAAVTNAVWDLGARLANKPLWRFVVEIPVGDLVAMIDWSYLSDVISEDEIMEMLSEGEHDKEKRIKHLEERGYPAYITSVGWLGYSDEKVKRLTNEKLSEGWTAFKMKVGISQEDDMRRAKLIRSLIGPDNKLMMDANQIWDVKEAITRMKQLKKYDPYWIEEPTSPDDVDGHAQISMALREHGIGVATGEMCQNRVMFKQFLKLHAMQFCQIDSCRTGGVSEVIAIMVLARKFGVPVVPHAGGVGLCELVRHYSMIDYVLVSGKIDDRMCEYAEHLHEHFTDQAEIKNARYVLPYRPGFSCEMTEYAVDTFRFPDGTYWNN